MTTFSRLSRKLVSTKNGATANCTAGGGARRPDCHRFAPPTPTAFRVSLSLLFQPTRRCFVSFPNPLDVRRSLVVVPKAPTATAPAVPSCSSRRPESLNDDEALAFAAEEAERLLAEVGKRKEYYKSKKRSTTTTEYGNKAVGSGGLGEDELVQQEVIEAVNTLLIVSNNSSLEDFVIRNKTKKNPAHITTARIASLHRAFIALTTQCLDCVQIIASSSSSQQIKEASERDAHLQALMDPALALARRAHDLGFPFHLPLYQRLMGAVATTPAKTATIPETILEIAAFIRNTLEDAPVDCALFQPSLLALVQAEKFPQVVELLHAMRDQHGITAFDPQSVFDLYTQTHEVLRRSLARGDDDDEKRSTTSWRRQLPEDAVTEIAVILEPSVLNLSTEIERRFDEEADNIKRAINEAVDELDAEEAESMITQIEQEEEEDEEDNSNNETESLNAQISNYAEEDPLDQIITAIITKRVTDKTAKNLFSDMIKYGRLMKNSRTSLGSATTNTTTTTASTNSSGGAAGGGNTAASTTKAIPAVIEIRAAPITNKDSQIKEIDYWADSSSESEDDAQDRSMLASSQHGDQLLLPDVTKQVEELNQGRALKFTRRYRDVLWIREAEQDLDAADSEKAYSSSSSSSYGNGDADSDVSSDDDDSGEEY